ncbi:MAG: hypothetical protein ABI678_20325 [Kofleriaceae bacterium]
MNPAFANASAGSIVWVAPIACEHNAPDPGQAGGLQLESLAHPGQIPATAELEAAACAELAASGGHMNASIDKSWQGTSALTSAVKSVANGSALAVVVGNDDACVPSQPHECDDSPSLKSWAVFLFDANGRVREFRRRDPMFPGTGDGPGDVAKFAER